MDAIASLALLRLPLCCNFADRHLEFETPRVRVVRFGLVHDEVNGGGAKVHKAKPMDVSV